MAAKPKRDDSAREALLRAIGAWADALVRRDMRGAAKLHVDMLRALDALENA